MATEINYFLLLMNGSTEIPLQIQKRFHFSNNVFFSKGSHVEWVNQLFKNSKSLPQDISYPFRGTLTEVDLFQCPFIFLSLGFSCCL